MKQKESFEIIDCHIHPYLGDNTNFSENFKKLLT